MNKQHRLAVIDAILLLGLVAACSTPAPAAPSAPVVVTVVSLPPTATVAKPSTPAPTEISPASMANPASVYCQQQGGKTDIRRDAKGNEVGYCVFADKSECEEWAFQRGECKPEGKPTTRATAVSTATVQVKKSDNGKTIQTVKGSVVQVTLEGAPGSTGYTWNLTGGNDGVLEPQFDPAKPLDVYTPGGSMPGAPGIYGFKFAAVRAGTATLKFENKQAWVQNDPPAETFIVTVVVK